MKDKKTKKHIVRWILLALFVVVLVMACIFSHFGGFGTGKCGFVATGENYFDDTQYQGEGKPIRVLRWERE